MKRIALALLGVALLAGEAAVAAESSSPANGARVYRERDRPREQQCRTVIRERVVIRNNREIVIRKKVRVCN